MELPKIELSFNSVNFESSQSTCYPSWPHLDCLVWVYDSECEIGYFWTELLKWDGESWINMDGEDFGEWLGEPKIMFWAYLTEPKNSERPDGEDRNAENT